MSKISITRPMFEYYNECKKKPTTIYKNYMWVL